MTSFSGPLCKMRRGTTQPCLNGRLQQLACMHSHGSPTPQTARPAELRPALSCLCCGNVLHHREVAGTSTSGLLAPPVDAGSRQHGGRAQQAFRLGPGCSSAVSSGDRVRTALPSAHRRSLLAGPWPGRHIHAPPPPWPAPGQPWGSCSWGGREDGETLKAFWRRAGWSGSLGFHERGFREGERHPGQRQHHSRGRGGTSRKGLNHVGSAAPKAHSGPGQGGGGPDTGGALNPA